MVVGRRWTGGCMPRSTHTHPSFDIVALGPHEWRVADVTGDPADGNYLLAYIEEADSGYDILSVSPGPPMTTHADTFTEALRCAESRARPGSKKRAGAGNPGKPSKPVAAASNAQPLVGAKARQRP